MSKIRLQWASAGREYKKFVLTTLLFNTLFDLTNLVQPALAVVVVMLGVPYVILV